MRGIVLFMLFYCPALMAETLSIDISPFYDSNPYRLSQYLDITSAEAVRYDVNIDYRFPRSKSSQFFVSASSDGTKYRTVADDANRKKSAISFGHEQKEKIRGHKIKKQSQWRGELSRSDSTFVNRTTGDIAQSNGQSVANRFDSDALRVNHLSIRPLGRSAFWSSSLSLLGKNYHEDYAHLGLDRLDYIELEPELSIGRKTPSSRWQLSLPLAIRAYRDRRKEDADGVDIPGSDLRYQYQGISGKYIWRGFDKLSLSLKAEYRLRSDNGVGFRDADKYKVILGSDYQVTDNSRMSIDVGQSSKEFRRDAVGTQQLDETNLARRARHANVSWRTRFADQLSSMVELTWVSVDNASEPLFSYERFMVSAGLKKKF